MTRTRPAVAAAAAFAAAVACAGAAPALAAKPFRDVRAGEQRTVERTGAPLAGPAVGDPADIAMRYVRGHLAQLGLKAGDVGSLKLAERVHGAGGLESVRFIQVTDGIPAFDNGLAVVVARDGSVVRAAGAPQHDLDVSSATPSVTAREAMRRVRENVGASGSPSVVSGPEGVTRRQEFSSGDKAELVVFGEGDSARLGWQLTAHGPHYAWYAAVVDARTGAILYRSNLTRFANEASVWEQYPGAPAARGGTAATQDLSRYLDSSGVLSGPFAHVWSDLNDDFFDENGNFGPGPEPDSGEEIARTGTSFMFPFTTFSPANSGCVTAKPCSWSHLSNASKTTNREQNAVQAFYFVNRYHDHLAAPPISFSAADGDFQGADRVLVNTDDGAGLTGPRVGAHRNNAFMSTPPDGTSPIMGMFLFTGSGFRDMNGGDDAAIVYHEYTHGLSSRLVTVNQSGGAQALNEEQAASMGEGWSDWYAKDFLVSQFNDDTPAVGDVDMGEYTDRIGHSIRSQGLDCPVGTTDAACPGSLSFTHVGGYTYGDYNDLDLDPDTGGHEVHEGGEIWGETLWDLRTALGSVVARQIVTEGMRSFTPPEPSMLDARDGIIAADRTVFGQGAHTAAIWQVFANRGMGTQAQAGVIPDPAPDVVVEDFNRPPTVTMTAAPQQANTGDTITFDASGTNDPDGTIAGYHWDFGDGSTVDTSGPRVTHVYGATGTFTTVVTVTDDSGGSETDSAAVTIGSGPGTTPTPTPTPTPTVTPTPTPTVTPGPDAPVIRLPRSGSHGRVRITVTCDSACSGTAKLTISRKLARTLHLKKRTLVVRRVSLTGAGTKRYTLRLSRKVTRAMKRGAVRRLTASLRATVRDAELQQTSAKRSSRIRR